MLLIDRKKGQHVTLTLPSGVDLAALAGATINVLLVECSSSVDHETGRRRGRAKLGFQCADTITITRQPE